MEDTITIVLDNQDVLSGVCGANDGNLKAIEMSLGGRISARGNEIRLEGVDEAGLRCFRSIMDNLIAVVREGENPSPEFVRALVGTCGSEGIEVSDEKSNSGQRSLSQSKSEPKQVSAAVNGSGEMGRIADPIREAMIQIPHGFSRVYPRSKNQALYIQGMRSHEISFCIGPAGTGKTFLAIAEALRLVLSKKMRKLVLTRPVVEAGESLGFLPGDLIQKINPYLRPLYDAMEALIPYEVIRHMEETRTIEIAPLAYMRGRSLNEAVIILDEAQNTTKEQMKMFLTRIGEGAWAVITGDATQIDLPKRVDSGLLHAVSILSHVEGIHFTYLHTGDVVRNPLIKKIIQAYDNERHA